MENQDVYTAAQESWIDGQYSKFYAALYSQDYESAELIIAEVKFNEFEKVEEDMEKILASKKLHHGN